MARVSRSTCASSVSHSQCRNGRSPTYLTHSNRGFTLASGCILQSSNLCRDSGGKQTSLSFTRLRQHLHTNTQIRQHTSFSCSQQSVRFIQYHEFHSSESSNTLFTTTVYMIRKSSRSRNNHMRPLRQLNSLSPHITTPRDQTHFQILHRTNSLELFEDLQCQFASRCKYQAEDSKGVFGPLLEDGNGKSDGFS